MEWASLSIRGLPVRAPHACRTGAAIANPTNSSAKNMWMSIVKPVTKRTPPISEKASERSIWARKWRANEGAVVIPELLLGATGTVYDGLARATLAGAVQGGLVDGAGFQAPVHDVVHRAGALQGLPYRPEQPPLPRRGEDEDLAHLEVVVPGASLLGGSSHLDEDRRDPDPGQRADKEYRRQRDEDHERRDPDGGRRDGEQHAEDDERDGEAYGHLEPALVPGDHDVARPLGERLRLAHVLALEDHRQVVAVNPELLELPDGLVELDPVVYHPYNGVLGDLLWCLPPFQALLPPQRWLWLPFRGGFCRSTAYMLAPLHTRPSPTTRGNLFHTRRIRPAV